MDNDYYSLTAILADNHKLPCQFTLDVPGLGYLEGTEADLHAGAKVELPLWVGQTLAVNRTMTSTGHVLVVPSKVSMAGMTGELAMTDPFSSPPSSPLLMSLQAQKLMPSEFVTFSVPTPFSARVRAALNASATALRLSNFVGQGGWWYRFGAAVAQMWDNGDSLLNMLHKAFVDRLPSLQDLAAHHASADHSIPEQGAGSGEAFRDGMEADERALFLVGQESGRAVKCWYDATWGKRK